MSGSSAGDGGGRRRPRRHRRVDAPPTNPCADTADDVPAGQRQDAPVPTADPAPARDAREAWIRSQRPPHWD